MRWNAEHVARLEALAAQQQSSARIAWAMGIGANAIRKAAQRYGIRLVRAERRPRGPYRGPSPEPLLRERWEKLLPQLKRQLAGELRDAADR